MQSYKLGPVADVETGRGAHVAEEDGAAAARGGRHRDVQRVQQQTAPLASAAEGDVQEVLLHQESAHPGRHRLLQIER